MVNPAPQQMDLSARIQTGSLDVVLLQIMVMHAGSAEIITFLVNSEIIFIQIAVTFGKPETPNNTLPT